MEVLNKELIFKIKVIPTRGGGEGLALILGGHAHCGATYPGPAQAQSKGKQVRALAV